MRGWSYMHGRSEGTCGAGNSIRQEKILTAYHIDPKYPIQEWGTHSGVGAAGMRDGSNGSFADEIGKRAKWDGVYGKNICQKIYFKLEAA